MCETCTGTGRLFRVDENTLVADPSLSILDGAVRWFGDLRRGERTTWPVGPLEPIAAFFGDDLEQPWESLSVGFRRAIFYGLAGDEEGTRRGRRRPLARGLVPEIERLFRATESEATRAKYAAYMEETACAACRGSGLGREALLVKLAGKSVDEVQDLSITELDAWASELASAPHPAAMVIRPIVREIRVRLRHVMDVGLAYLSLSRTAPTLSAGEAQRLRIARQLGIGLTGILYVLDEPSIGLHARDLDRLITALISLRDAGNTILVVEHDEATIRAADGVIDLGPGAGPAGGRVVATGTPADLAANAGSVTGPYLAGAVSVLDDVPPPRSVEAHARHLRLTGARLHNLQAVTLDIPLGHLIAVSGVSGSGKSSLILGTLVPALARRLGVDSECGPYDALENVERIDKVIEVDQLPIGRTPRSCPATYMGIMDDLRALFAATEQARALRLGPEHFSFNAEGRCPTCRGLGSVCVEMHFLPDVWMPCAECEGRRFVARTLEVRWRGLDIAAVLARDVGSAIDLFADVPAIGTSLAVLDDVGLGYLGLGQSATTLSGGEAQRLKLARELVRPSGRRALYVLDEPTTGLHFADITRLLRTLRRLVGRRHTVVVIEHHLDVLRAADWIVDLGPDGGTGGGRILHQGPVADLLRHPTSHTGRWLRTTRT